MADTEFEKIGTDEVKIRRFAAQERTYKLLELEDMKAALQKSLADIEAAITLLK